MNRTSHPIRKFSASRATTTIRAEGTTARQQAVSMEACVTAVLSAVNRHFGTDFGWRNIVGQPFRYGGAMNLNLTTSGLEEERSNSLQLGRYPLSFLTWLTGCGPTLHITTPDRIGEGTLLERASFAPSSPRKRRGKARPRNDRLTLFRAHIDSAYAYHPAGFVAHLLVDVLYFGKIRGRIAGVRTSIPHAGAVIR